MPFSAIPVVGNLMKLWPDQSQPAALHDELGQRFVVMRVPEDAIDLIAPKIGRPAHGDPLTARRRKPGGR